MNRYLKCRERFTGFRYTLVVFSNYANGLLDSDTLWSSLTVDEMFSYPLIKEVLKFEITTTVPLNLKLQQQSL